MNPIYLALDMDDAAEAYRILDEVRGFIGGVKIGLTLFYHSDRPLISHIIHDFDCFLDLKWKDIPMQVAGALRGVMSLHPAFVSIHEDGGPDMIEAAADAATTEAQFLNLRRPRVLAVTILTSLKATHTEVVARAFRALMYGADGVICSPLEVRHIRYELGIEPILMTPGIRMPDDPPDEHQRSATPREAMDAGANYLVVGRPITKASSPRDAARKILASLG